jgi:hypothetical protein
MANFEHLFDNFFKNGFECGLKTTNRLLVSQLTASLVADGYYNSRSSYSGSSSDQPRGPYSATPDPPRGPYSASPSDYNRSPQVRMIRQTITSVGQCHEIFYFKLFILRNKFFLISWFHKTIQIFLRMYFSQHCFICRPSDYTVSEGTGIEPKTVATSALTARRSNHSARSQSHQHLINLVTCANFSSFLSPAEKIKNNIK